MRMSVALLFAVSASAFATPVHLKTNGLESPLGLDTPKPVFSWRSEATRPNWMQSNYEVLVATDPALLAPGKADAWDSGRIKSSESVNVLYGGSVLKPQQRYLWSVKTWDDKGKEETSAHAWFETGLTTIASWKGEWITRTDPADTAEIKAMRWIWVPGVDAMHVPSGSVADFRYVLHLNTAPQAGSLHVLTRGKVIAKVNGKETGHHDEWGAFDREEIGYLLHAGDNEIDLHVVSPTGKKDPEGVKSAVAAAIRVTDATGKETRVVTDAGWKVRSSSTDAWADAKVAGPLSAPFGLGPDRHTPIPGPDRVATDASLLRKDFSIEKKISSARLTMTALGAYEASVNGNAVAPDALLAPGWTDFHKRVLYQTYDVTSLLQPGTNTIGVELGGGWYSSPMTWVGARFTPGPNMLRGQLDLTFDDGTHQVVATDPTWQTAPSPVTFSEIYGGESYDARLMKAGWGSPGFTGSGWTPAIPAAPSDSALAMTAQPDLSIHTTITLHPLTLDPANAAHPTIYDMGQNMVGNLRIHVQGPRGTVVKLRYAERLNPDGSIYTQNLRNADATDTYALAGGSAEEVWTPAFTFHGFRYVELSYLGTITMPAPTLATIEGLVFNSLPTTPTVRLSSSSATLNKMNELGAWGQRGNFVSIPTDCPQRDERLGWMGDAGVFWRTGTYNFDIDGFTHKFMLDVEDAQTAAGAFTDVSPNVLGRQEGAPGWGDAGVFIPYAAWMQYGDATAVLQAWPAMERWMDFIQTTNPNFLRQKSLGNNYADWLAPDQATPKDLIATAYWALIAREMVEMAKGLGRPEDVAKYQAVYDHIAEAYRAAYIKPDGTVAGDTQTSYLATIATGIAPPSLRANMVDRAVKNIEAHGEHLTTGFLGTPFLLFVLDENDRSDVAFKLLLSDTYPSWGYMVKKGATTWWERWNGDTGDPGMNSYNHYAFGSVMAWVYRRAAGIDTDAAGVGYHHVVVHPHFDAALPQLHTEYDSVYGTIVSDWAASSHRFTVTIPPNTTATVMLPGGKTETVGSGTHGYTIKP